MALLALATSAPAVAAEVVWLTAPTPEDAARLAALAEATRGPMSPAELRALLTAETALDGDVIEELARVREEVRVHEAVLDGEKLILEAIERALAPVALLRDPADRDVVVGALLYQGFAVDRYFGPTLADDPVAAPYRMTIDDRVVERPWVDAFSLDPLRKVAASDIGEEPSREAYESLRQRLARTLRAKVVIPDLPPQSIVFLDGAPVVDVGEGIVEVLPGRHWLHVEHGGQVIAREAVRLEPGQRFELLLPLSEASWQQLARAVRAGEGVVPREVLPFLEPLGGEVWIAQGRGQELRVVRVDANGIAPVDVTDRFVTVAPARGRLGDVAVAAFVGAGVLHSPDFALAPPSGRAGAPLAAPPVGGLELSWDRGWLRYGLGVEALVPLGAEQVALSGPATYRARALPYLSLGHPLIQAHIGYLFPHHRVGGVVATVPVVPLGEHHELEVRAAGRMGGASPVARADGSIWQAQTVVSASIALGVRLRPGRGMVQ